MTQEEIDLEEEVILEMIRAVRLGLFIRDNGPVGISVIAKKLNRSVDRINQIKKDAMDKMEKSVELRRRFGLLPEKFFE